MDTYSMYAAAVPRRTAATRWGATLAATAASTWALDAAAAATGGLLVATGLLHEATRGVVLAVLAASYLAWAAGIRTNIRANLRLLEDTGTSTSALSKAAFDLARRKRVSPPRVRLASAVGYVLVEVAKEVPYYAGAFGVAVMADSVTSSDALVFLAGANLGAAGYEWSLGRLTSGWLERRSDRRAQEYASFDQHWEPRAYLRDYYSEVEPDERATIAFFVEAMRHVVPGEPVLLFGVGPTLHHVFLAAPFASEIHLADYLPGNLAEIERWLAQADGAHDWSAFVDYTLRCEGVASPSAAQVNAREDLVRANVSALLAGDARWPDPLGGCGTAPYATVISAYCADSATGDLDTWESYLRHIGGLVRPGGLFVTAALRRSSGYLVGNRIFPSANVHEDDLHRVLQPEFDWADGSLVVRDLPAHADQGYTGILLARARRRAT